MTAHDRRAFLQQLARGAAYSAPLIITVSAPVVGQSPGMSSEHNPMGGGHGHTSAIQQDGPLPPPPGGQPPGREPPGTRPNP